MLYGNLLCCPTARYSTAQYQQPSLVLFFLFFTLTKPPPDHKKHQIISLSCIALLRMPYYYCSSKQYWHSTYAHSRPNLVSYSLPTTTTSLHSAVCTVRTVPDSRSLTRTTCCIICYYTSISITDKPPNLLHRQTPPLPYLILEE